MTKSRFRVPDIKSWTPALDARNSEETFVLTGRNYIFDSKGPKSGFGTRLIQGLTSIENEAGLVQSISVANRTFVFSTTGVREFEPYVDREWKTLLDLTPYDYVIFNPEKKWTGAFVAGGVYFCHESYGFFKLNQLSITKKTQDDILGLVDRPIAVAECNGRLIILGQNYVGWSAPNDAENFVPELGGAGQQLLSEWLAGQPKTLMAFESGFIVYTSNQAMLAEYIGGDAVWRFSRFLTDQIPLGPWAVDQLPDGSQLMCTKQGIHHTEDGQNPKKIVPIFNEFLRSVLEHEAGITVRINYQMEVDRLYVQLRDWTNHYIRTYALQIALDKWGEFSERHLGIIKYRPQRGYFGYVDQAGVAHRFRDWTRDRETAPHEFEGLNSMVELGYVKPPELHGARAGQGEIDSLLEMHEITIGGRARPSWSVPTHVDLGTLPDEPAVECDSEDQETELIISNSLSLSQMNQNWDADYEMGVEDWFEAYETVGEAVNLDTGEIHMFVYNVGDYTSPDAYTDTTYLNSIESDGSLSTSYYAGVWDDAQSTTHYLYHDLDIQADRYNGDVWAIHDWYLTQGSTLARNVKANAFAMQATKFPVLHPNGADEDPDEGLGVVNRIAGFTEDLIIIQHEVIINRDFKWEALNKDTLTRVSQAYMHPGVGNINGAIESGDHYGYNHCCMGGDGNLYHATSDNGTAFLNGTSCLLFRFNPVSGDYDNITPWSSVSMPMDSERATATNMEVKYMFWCRVTERVIIVFGVRFGDYFDAAGEYDWELGAYDPSDESFTKLGRLPQTGRLDDQYEETEGMSYYYVGGIAFMDVAANMDALPMQSPCQEYIRTLECLWHTPEGALDNGAGVNDEDFSLQICVRDPSDGYRVITRFNGRDPKYATMLTGTGFADAFKFVFGFNSQWFGITGEILPVHYLPTRQYYAPNGSLYSWYYDNVAAANRDYNFDWSNSYAFFRP